MGFLSCTPGHSEPDTVWGAASGTHRLSGVSSTVVLVGLNSPVSSEDASIYFRRADVPLGSHSAQTQGLLPSQLPTLCQGCLPLNPDLFPTTAQTKWWQWATSQLVGDILNIGHSFNTKLMFKHSNWLRCWVVRCKEPASCQLCCSHASQGFYPVHVGWQGSSFWLVIQGWYHEAVYRDWTLSKPAPA